MSLARGRLSALGKELRPSLRRRVHPPVPGPTFHLAPFLFLIRAPQYSPALRSSSSVYFNRLLFKGNLKASGTVQYGTVRYGRTVPYLDRTPYRTVSYCTVPVPYRTVPRSDVRSEPPETLEPSEPEPPEPSEPKLQLH